MEVGGKWNMHVQINNCLKFLPFLSIYQYFYFSSHVTVTDLVWTIPKNGNVGHWSVARTTVIITIRQFYWWKCSSLQYIYFVPLTLSISLEDWLFSAITRISTISLVEIFSSALFRRPDRFQQYCWSKVVLTDYGVICRSVTDKIVRCRVHCRD